MAGVTDAAFRRIAIEQGAGLTYTEMVSAKGLKYGNKKTTQLISPAANEDFFGVQLFASDTNSLKQSIEMIQTIHEGAVSVFDINMGCPAAKVTNNGEGSALMKEPKKASGIIAAAVKASSIPVTVKFRKGWDETSVNAVEFAKMCEESGSAAVAVHGRTRAQFYSGHSDNDIIAQVKSAVSIPVIGNGDIFCAGDAVNMFNETGCDAVMVARGAQGNPFIFREILHLMKTGSEAQPPTSAEKATAMLSQAKLSVVEKGEYLAMRQMRKHASWYLKGVRGAARARDEAVKMETFDDLVQLISKVFPELDVTELLNSISI
jgi:tRNA-dihydrouridine synthase B